MREEGVGQHVAHRGERAGQAAVIAGNLRERALQLAAVFGAERGGVEAEQRPVESRRGGGEGGSRTASQAVSGVSPVARASRTSSVSRRISARATAVPNGVIR